jgi:DNA-binding response OmpR family regulator
METTNMTDDILAPAPTTKRILVVDDDPEVRRLTSASLEQASYEVQLADSGEKALEILNDEGLPHLAIIDIRLPGLDGLALCQRIQGISDVPVIMLTVVDDEETVVKAIEEFAEDYIIKPFNPPELVARVVHYILMQNAGKTVLTNYILGRVWSNQSADENTLRVHIHRLRQKIEVSPSRPRYVVTERGAGYSFLAPPEAA